MNSIYNIYSIKGINVERRISKTSSTQWQYNNNLRTLCEYNETLTNHILFSRKFSSINYLLSQTYQTIKISINWFYYIYAYVTTPTLKLIFSGCVINYYIVEDCIYVIY